MYVIYSLRECHYLKRTKIEVKLKICILLWVFPSKPWCSSWCFSSVPGSSLPNRWSTKKWASVACGQEGVQRHPLHAPPYRPAIYAVFPLRFYDVPRVPYYFRLWLPSWTDWYKWTHATIKLMPDKINFNIVNFKSVRLWSCQTLV